MPTWRPQGTIKGLPDYINPLSFKDLSARNQWWAAWELCWLGDIVLLGQAGSLPIAATQSVPCDVKLGLHCFVFHMLQVKEKMVTWFFGNHTWQWPISHALKGQAKTRCGNDWVHVTLQAAGANESNPAGLLRKLQRHHPPSACGNDAAFAFMQLHLGHLEEHKIVMHGWSSFVLCCADRVAAEHGLETH